ANHFYSSHLGRQCPWCDRVSQIGRDPFPSTLAIQRGEHIKRQARPRIHVDVQRPAVVPPWPPQVPRSPNLTKQASAPSIAQPAKASTPISTERVGRRALKIGLYGLIGLPIWFPILAAAIAPDVPRS